MLCDSLNEVEYKSGESQNQGLCCYMHPTFQPMVYQLW